MKLEDAKILIGDDSILARKLLKDIISEVGGVHYLEASNGEEAVQLATTEHPDIIFLDIVMPVKDGITSVKEIKAAGVAADIIIVSSVGTQGQLKEAISSGASDFIQKPFHAEQIKSILDVRFEGGK